MANPKHKMSRSRTRKRRAHDSIDAPALSVCSNCKEMKMPHRICLACGYYDGREVVSPEKEKQKSQ